jgi:ABC-type transport system involved in cytochrome bd biosynthesis fused ATPase/permease subunit
MKMSVYAVDTVMSLHAENSLRAMVNCLICLVLIAITAPWFLVILPPSVIVFVLLYAVFRVGFLRLQRRRLASLSPLLAHVDGTVRGLSSIHAYGLTSSFAQRFVCNKQRRSKSIHLRQRR